MEKPLFKAPKIANLYQCYPNAHFTVTIIFHRFYQMCKCDFKNHVFKTHITYLQKRIFLNNLPKQTRKIQIRKLTRLGHELCEILLLVKNCREKGKGNKALIRVQLVHGLSFGSFYFNIPFFWPSTCGCSLQFCEAICPRYIYNNTAGPEIFV